MSRFPSDEQAIRAGKEIVAGAVLLAGIVGAAAAVGGTYVLLVVLGLFGSAHAIDLTLLAVSFALLLGTSTGLALAWLSRWKRVHFALGAWFGAVVLTVVALSLANAMLLAVVLALSAGAGTLAVVCARSLR